MQVKGIIVGTGNRAVNKKYKNTCPLGDCVILMGGEQATNQ